ncbi:hypothetical protein [Allokutzneria multivorans]|uniref:hypothetical protein n=1 Tax=Allokutzneria multivorans TaxID=1142134 RepID=UPI0031E55253
MSSTGTVRSWGERLRAVAVRLAVTGGLAATAWLAVATTATADEAPARVDVLSPSVVLEQGQRPADAATPAGVLVEPATANAIANTTAHSGPAARLRAAKAVERSESTTATTAAAPAAVVRGEPGANHSELRDLIKDLLRLRIASPAPEPGEDPSAGLTRPLPEPELPNLLPAGPERPALGNHSSGEVSAERPKPLPWPGGPVTLPAADDPPAQAPADEAGTSARHTHHVSARPAPARAGLSLGGSGDAKKDGVPTLPHEDTKPNPVQTGTSPTSGNGLAESGPQRGAAGLPALLLPPPVLSVTGVVYGDGVVPVAGFLSRPATSPD